MKSSISLLVVCGVIALTSAVPVTDQLHAVIKPDDATLEARSKLITDQAVKPPAAIGAMLAREIEKRKVVQPVPPEERGLEERSPICVPAGSPCCA